MRKILLLITAAFLSFSLNAQEPTGKVSLDFNFDPASFFDAAAGAMFHMPGIKARYFLQPELAARVGIYAGFDSSKDFQDLDGEDYQKSTNAYFTLSPGIEKHFASEKFSAYVGAELPIGISSSSIKVVDNDEETVFKNVDGDDHLGIGLHAVLGFDYYIFGKVYIGAEFNPGLELRKIKDSKTDDNVTNVGGTEIDFSIASSSGIKIGVRF